MNEFGQKGNVSYEDIIIHILNNLPEEYDIILDGLENHHTAIGENALTIDTIRENLNHRYEKDKNKKEEKHEKEKALSGWLQQTAQTVIPQVWNVWPQTW